jgi:hypothetical protein
MYSYNVQEVVHRQLLGDFTRYQSKETTTKVSVFYTVNARKYYWKEL